MRESRGQRVNRGPLFRPKAGSGPPLFAGVTDSVLLTHAPLLLREPAARGAWLDYWTNVLRGYFVPAKSTILLPDSVASLRRLVAHPTVEEHAQRRDEGKRMVQNDEEPRIGNLK